ncbi:hypothetical protein PC114_g12489 [Phytophthora cactorum]|nr:hypothetical protein PC114_g12489 [Phytophthora cactorum]KAG3173959.1 hypothetical protein C6341_g9854 [Phytophthora cactorum]
MTADGEMDLYVKPGCRVKGSKQGVDFFNGEDELIVCVRSDKNLFARLNIVNVMVRSDAHASSY